MRVVETKNTTSGPPAAGHADAGVSAARPAADSVSMEDTNRVQASVSEALRAASAGRALRLAALTQQVRSGTYAPDPARLAEEILAQAEVSAHLANSLH